MDFANPHLHLVLFSYVRNIRGGYVKIYHLNGRGLTNLRPETANHPTGLPTTHRFVLLTVPAQTVTLRRERLSPRILNHCTFRNSRACPLETPLEGLIYRRCYMRHFNAHTFARLQQLSRESLLAAPLRVLQISRFLISHILYLAACSFKGSTTRNPGANDNPTRPKRPWQSGETRSHGHGPVR